MDEARRLTCANLQLEIQPRSREGKERGREVGGRYNFWVKKAHSLHRLDTRSGKKRAGEGGG